MRFSQREIKDIIIAWAMISVAFGIVFRSHAPLETAIMVSFVTVGIGFVLHELAHKLVAQRMNKFAEFHAFMPMLVLAVAMSFLGIVIAAPGAVFISGFVSRKENGIIAAAGPITNIALAILFIPLFVLAAPGSVLGLIGAFGFGINALLALFNMIPFWMFDGAKIISWNKVAYGAITAVSFLLVLASTALNVF